MDREKIMNGLQAIAENKACQNCCYPYMGYGVICGQEIARNAITLLKELEDGYKNILSDYEELAREHEKLLYKKIPLITNGQEVIRCKDCTYYTGGIDRYCDRWFRRTGGNMSFCNEADRKDEELTDR